MKKFIKDLMLFLGIILVINFCFYLARESGKIFSPYHGYQRPAIEMKNYRSFLLGDSHAAAMNRAPEKFGIANFAFNSDNYLDQLIKARYLIEEQSIQVDSLFISVDRHMLSTYRDQKNNIDKSAAYVSLSSVGKYSKHISFARLTKEKLKYYFPVFDLKYAELYRSRLLSSASPGRGGLKQLAEYTDLARKQALASRLDEQFSSQESSVLMKKAMEDLLKTANENQVTVILLRYPLNAEYLESLGGKDYFQKEHLDLITSQYRYIDAEKWLGDDDLKFKDHDHMNAKGTEDFLRRLTEVLGR